MAKMRRHVWGYTIYTPQMGNAHLCPEWSAKTDLCPNLCSRAKMRGKIFAPEEKTIAKIRQRSEEFLEF